MNFPRQQNNATKERCRGLIRDEIVNTSNGFETLNVEKNKIVDNPSVFGFIIFRGSDKTIFLQP